MSNLFNLFWIFLILVSLQPVLQRQLLAQARKRAPSQIAHERGSAVTTLIHRQETMSILGFPVMRYIDVDDSESVLRDIRATPSGIPIDVVLHTPGGLVLAATQIASALADHDAPVRAIVPHYAMRGGTLVALAADEIEVDPHAALGPVDPQVGEYPAASIVVAAQETKDPDDKTLILADVSRKALRQVQDFIAHLLEGNMEPEQAKEVLHVLASGVWTHDYPLGPEELRKLGLPVKVGIPNSAYDLMALYPQPRGRQSAVEYVPSRPRPELPPASRPRD